MNRKANRNEERQQRLMRFGKKNIVTQELEGGSVTSSVESVDIEQVKIEIQGSNVRNREKIPQIGSEVLIANKIYGGAVIFREEMEESEIEESNESDAALEFEASPKLPLSKNEHTQGNTIEMLFQRIQDFSNPMLKQRSMTVTRPAINPVTSMLMTTMKKNLNPNLLSTETVDMLKVNEDPRRGSKLFKALLPERNVTVNDEDEMDPMHLIRYNGLDVIPEKPDDQETK